MLQGAVTASCFSRNGEFFASRGADEQVAAFLRPLRPLHGCQGQNELKPPQLLARYPDLSCFFPSLSLSLSLTWMSGAASASFSPSPHNLADCQNFIRLTKIMCRNINICVHTLLYMHTHTHMHMHTHTHTHTHTNTHTLSLSQKLFIMYCVP